MSIPHSDLSEGHRIGPYTLLQRIGSGASGEAWLVERDSRVIKTRLAMKLLREGTDLESIRQEARLWIDAANHPNVLPLFEADIYDGRFTLVSEYVADGSLEDWLSQRGGKAPTIRSAAEIAIGILAGLGHLHTLGVIHRDVKPGNILMQSGTPRLTDFGLARKPELDGATCRIAGTPFYMAPEALEGMRTPQTDLWSVGVILFQLVFGDLPFRHAEFAYLANAIRSGWAVNLPAEVPHSVRQVLMRSLDADRHRRYVTAEAMNFDVRALLAQKDIDSPERETATVTTLPDSFIVLEVRGEPQVFDPNEDRRIIIGRHPDCDVALATASASRKHAMILFDQDKGWVLQDLDSRNGLFLNDRRVERAILNIGDTISIGEESIRVSAICVGQRSTNRQ